MKAVLPHYWREIEKKLGVGKMARMQPLLTLRCASSSSVSLVSHQGCLSLFPGLFTERWQETFAQHFAVCRTSIFPAWYVRKQIDHSPLSQTLSLGISRLVFGSSCFEKTPVMKNICVSGFMFLALFLVGNEGGRTLWPRTCLQSWRGGVQ